MGRIYCLKLPKRCRCPVLILREQSGGAVASALQASARATAMQDLRVRRHDDELHPETFYPV